MLQDKNLPIEEEKKLSEIELEQISIEIPKRKRSSKRRGPSNWKPSDVERRPNCCSDLLVERPILWIVTNLVLFALIGY